MIVRLLLAALVLACTGPVLAHPHVWITMKSEVLVGPNGAVTGIRHRWTFDDMFSAFALQGTEAKAKGQYTREELAPLAKVNIDSLKEYDYFTYATADGKKVELAPPTSDYWLDYKDSVLTLNFTLMVKTPVKAKEFKFDIYALRSADQLARIFLVEFEIDEDGRVAGRVRRACCCCRRACSRRR